MLVYQRVIGAIDLAAIYVQNFITHQEKKVNYEMWKCR